MKSLIRAQTQTGTRVPDDYCLFREKHGLFTQVWNVESDICIVVSHQHVTQSAPFHEPDCRLIVFTRNGTSSWNNLLKAYQLSRTIFSYQVGKLVSQNLDKPEGVLNLTMLYQ